MKSEEGRDALGYLTDERGISDEVIDRFNVGFCPPRIRHELSNRIITPIYDVYGDPVAVSSRHLKYKKNFWHESFEKSFHLYGLHIARRHIARCKKVLIVEGEFDVLFLHSLGVDIAVGLCGSALSIFQLALLSRYCDEIFVAYDGDDKRDQSIARLEKLCASKSITDSGIKCYPVVLPLGYDPDDFVKEYGKSGLIQLLKNTQARRRKGKS